MADRSVVKHYLRLNLQNEQHLRIQKVLANLDKSIHKSENQFIIKAVDFYIRSFEEDDIIDRTRQEQNKKYLTIDDFADMRREIAGELKDEIIRLLASALVGSPIAKTQENMQKFTQKIETVENDLVAKGAANLWG